MQTIRRDKPQWAPHRYDGALTLLRPKVVPRSFETGLDDWGVGWIGTASDEGSYPDGKPVLGIDDIASFELPRTDWQMVTEDMRRQVAAKANVDTLLIAYNEMVLYERAQLLLGTAEFLMAVATAPEELELLFGQDCRLSAAIDGSPHGRWRGGRAVHRRLGHADRLVHLTRIVAGSSSRV